MARAGFPTAFVALTTLFVFQPVWMVFERLDLDSKADGAGTSDILLLVALGLGALAFVASLFAMLAQRGRAPRSSEPPKTAPSHPRWRAESAEEPRLADTGRTAVEAAGRIALETSVTPVVLLAQAAWPAPMSWMNRAARQMFGDFDHAVDLPKLDSLLEAGDPTSARVLEEAILGRTPARRFVRIRNRFGEGCEALVRLEPVNDGSTRAIVFFDIREHELNDLRARAHEAQTMRERLHRLERQSDQLESFAWSVSHDLRAPLRAVEGFTRIVLEDHATHLDEPARAHLGRVLTASARMERMLDALIGLSRVSSQPLLETPVDLARLGREVLESAMLQEPARNVRTHCDAALRVRGDPVLLRILLQNLLGNAWKYTARSENAQIRFDARRDERGRTVYCVADNGIGFDMAHADRLFGLFQRLHTQEDYPGTGIGLAVAQRIVQRHGGTIWAESTPDQGSRFFFTLDGRAMDTGSDPGEEESIEAGLAMAVT